MNAKKIREAFPALQANKIAYFDSACMSMKPKQVIEAMNQYYYEFPACAGRSMHTLGERVTHKVHDARKKVADFLGAKKDKEIIFTRNTTEGMNLIANSLDLKDGAVLITDKEHNSNLIPWLRAREKRLISELRFVNSKIDDNSFNIEEFDKELKKGNVKLVSLHQTSNLDGMSLPIKEITKIAHDHGAKILIDAAQSAPHTEVNVKKLDVDFLACSGHKMLAPSGIGVLYGKEEELERLKPFMVGGETVKDSWQDRYTIDEIPERFEAGLQNYSGIIGFGAAVDYLRKIGMEDIHSHEIMLNKRLTEGISTTNLRIIGNKNPEFRGGVLSFYSPKVDSHQIGIMLNSHGIMVRTGAFCVHSWFNKHKIKNAVRFSSYLYNTEEDCDKAIDFFNRALKGIV